MGFILSPSLGLTFLWGGICNVQGQVVDSTLSASLFLDPLCLFSVPPTKVNISLSFRKSCSMTQFVPFISWAMQKQGHLPQALSRVLPVSRVVGQTASLCGKRELRAQTLKRIFNLLLPPVASAGSQRHTAICWTSHTLSVLADASPLSSRFSSPACSHLRS